MLRLVATVLLIACSFVAVAANEAPVAARDDGFAEMFFSDAHMAECVAALDGLRERAHADVYESVRAQFGADLPQVETSTGILMLYSVAAEADTFYHSFSVSRAPYLATACGQVLVGLASLRFGLPVPPEIRVSPMQVYHAAWAFTTEQQQALLAAEPPEWPDPISTVAAAALVSTAFSELVSFDVDYEELESLIQESSESAN